MLIMQLRDASFILRMKNRFLLRSEVGMIMVSICLHGVISWSQASGRWRFDPTKTVIAEKFHPSVFKFCLTWTVYNVSNKMTEVLWRCLFIWACEGLSIPKALHIDVWEMAGVTAMAAGSEQTQSAHACDVSLGARILHTYCGTTVITYWTPQDAIDDRSTLVQVMAWCHQAATYYKNQCWPDAANLEM